MPAGLSFSSRALKSSQRSAHRASLAAEGEAQGFFPRDKAAGVERLPLAIGPERQIAASGFGLRHQWQTLSTLLPARNNASAVSRRRCVSP